MKNTLFLITFVVLGLAFGLSASAQTPPADFSGHWVGPGKLIQKPLLIGNPTEWACKKIEIWIEQTPDTLITRRYTADCALVPQDWGPDTMKIKPDGKVIHEDEEVGTLKGDTLITIDDTGVYKYAYNLKVFGSGKERTLDSYYAIRNGAGTFLTEGNGLKLVP